MTALRIARFAGLVLASLSVASGTAAAEPSAAAALARQLGTDVAAFTAQLEENQRDEALYEFDDDERFDLRLAPLGLEGLQVREMSDAQWSHLRASFAKVLSSAGLTKIELIRSLEAEVLEMEGGLSRLFMGRLRNAGRYFLALFGEPDPQQTWGLRFDGHHLSLNWTALPGEALSVTPLFLGGQPAEVPAGFERAGLRVLAAEEEQGLALARSLDTTQRATARLELERGSTISRPMFVGAQAQLDLDPPQGLARSAMNESQGAALDSLIDVYLGNFTGPIARLHRERIDAEADTIRFAYAGSAAVGEPSYYRIQGGSFLIEFDNTSPAADHIHVVWRDLRSDFGQDLLAEHRRAHHD